MNINQGHPSRYELQQRLANDAISEVWKAFDTQQRRYVVVKLMHVNTQSMPHAIERFTQKMPGLMSLRHTYIVPITDIQIAQEPANPVTHVSIVMEYIEGQILSNYIHAIRQTGNIPSVHEIARLMIPLISAVDYAYQQGVIHGAIRPSSIMLDKRGSTDTIGGTPKLIGFGTSMLQPLLTLPLNDLYYIAPEQAQGKEENAQSDIYALGAILYELCTGTPPYQGETPTAVIMQHINAAPTPPTRLNPRLLPELTAVIMRSLSKDPAARFSNAAAMNTALARALNISSQDLASDVATSSGGLATNSAGLGRGDGADEMLNHSTHLSSSPHYQAPAGLQAPTAEIAGPAATRTQQTPMPNFAMQQQWSQSMPMVAQVPSGSSQTGPQMTMMSPNSTSQPFPSVPASPTLFPPPLQTNNSLRGKKWFVPLIVLLAFLVVGVSLIPFFFLNTGKKENGPSPNAIAGHAFFVSTGQTNEINAQGIADSIQIDLADIPPPQPGKTYYIWLLGDSDSQTDLSPVLLGQSSNGGRIDLTYPGNASHTDMLATYSRFRITEEDAGITPANPSLDTRTWRYTASFSQAKSPGASYSLLDHLRHLLAQDPKLKQVGLVGGLDIWLFHNTLKLFEYAGSIRDAQNSGDTGLMRRQITRMLDYLVGSQYISTEPLPPDIAAAPLLIDATKARVALLQIDPQNQSPPGYLVHIGNHLREIISTPGTTADQRALAIRINNAINNVQQWLTAVHGDARKLIQMSATQLADESTRSIVDDMFVNTNNAFVGQVDPNTGLAKEGVSQIHYSIQGLATFVIGPFQAT
ncbi:MAG: hypothetical protein E6J34_17425 [Chloroflexi bacterium]|nr:MAG: hypothetical protein E6J34_17425 [Chloroflexota bacterium]